MADRGSVHNTGPRHPAGGPAAEPDQCHSCNMWRASLSCPWSWSRGRVAAALYSPSGKQLAPLAPLAPLAVSRGLNRLDHLLSNFTSIPVCDAYSNYTNGLSVWKQKQTCSKHCSCLDTSCQSRNVNFIWFRLTETLKRTQHDMHFYAHLLWIMIYVATAY